MNDKELADAVVALGVGCNGQVPGGYYFDHGRCYLGMSDRFVRDWRVAGALMEEVDSCYPEKLINESWQVQASMDAMPTEWIQNESLPRAIIEACVVALT